MVGVISYLVSGADAHVDGIALRVDGGKQATMPATY